jgi:predicted nucleic acid-binding protein
MLVVADASVLVAELLRERGRALLSDPNLRVVVAEDQWREAQYELSRRTALLVEQDRLTAEQGATIQQAIKMLVDDQVVEVIPRFVYEQMEATARRRIPRDPNDWPPIALALTLDAGILTADNDFLGCGCPTWSVDTLREELAHLKP